MSEGPFSRDAGHIKSVASGKYLRLLMNFANSLDPEEVPQNLGPHLRSKLYDTQIIDKPNFGNMQRVKNQL